MKTCIYCNIDKELTEFHVLKTSKDGKRNICKICERKRKQIYYKKNKETILTKAEKYRHENKEKIKVCNYKYNSKNKDKINAKKRKNKKQRNAYNLKYVKKRIAQDELFKFKICVKKLIKDSFRRKNHAKTLASEKILGCTFIEFKNYLESKFEAWMNWENKGRYNGTPNYGWDVDHIVPLSSAKNEDDIIKLNHYTNLQPLCSYINREVKRATM